MTSLALNLCTFGKDLPQNSVSQTHANVPFKVYWNEAQAGKMDPVQENLQQGRHLSGDDMFYTPQGGWASLSEQGLITRTEQALSEWSGVSPKAQRQS